MPPPNQGFNASHVVAAEFDERLVVHLKALIGQRLAQFPLQVEAGSCAFVHLGFEDPKRPPPVRFCLVERQIGVLQKLSDVTIHLAGQHNSGTHTDLNPQSVELVGRAD